MKKEELKQRVIEYGDAIINYRSKNSNKPKYNVCTCDFTTPYVKGKTKKVEEDENSVLLFCWDTDSYRLLDPRYVTSVTPLSSVLKNE